MKEDIRCTPVKPNWYRTAPPAKPLTSVPVAITIVPVISTNHVRGGVWEGDWEVEIGRVDDGREE
jgi:hypothetical protein